MKAKYRIGDAGTQRLRQVFRNTLDVDATHGTHSQSTDQRILISSILKVNRNFFETYTNEGLHSQKSQIGLLIGVVDEIQVAKLSHLDISLLHTVDDIDEKIRDVLLDSHQSNDLLQSVLFLIDAVGGKLLLQLIYFFYKLGNPEGIKPFLLSPKNLLVV